jgi:hypothetical protein
MTKPALFLRIASGLVLLQSVLHTIGGVFGKPGPGPASVAWTAMQANHFSVSGLDRTYANFYLGFGLGITISLVMEGLILWLLSNRVDTYAAIVRPMIGIFALGYLAIAVDSYLFFFPRRSLPMARCSSVL